jgi:hypothetical protein
VRDTGDIPTTVVIVHDDGTELAAGRVDTRTPDLALVDSLARLQLAARRHGWAIRVKDASEELCALLEFVGLAGVLAVEARRQAERGEQLRVEEVVQPGDLPA